MLWVIAEYGFRERVCVVGCLKIRGHRSLWFFAGYGLSQLWVMTELTVLTVQVLVLVLIAHYVRCEDCTVQYCTILNCTVSDQTGRNRGKYRPSAILIDHVIHCRL